MKNNIIENNFLYRPWEAIRISDRLDREVDGVLLERAVQQGTKRYPYLCVRVRRNGEELEMDFNENPVPVHRGRTPLVLGSESAGGHFIAVCYEGDWLFFDVYHNLCDANGLVCFIKTVMYLYLKSAADPNLDPTGILLPGTSIPESETGDPYEGLEFPKNIRPLYNRQFSRSFIPDRRYASGDSRYTYVVKTSQADFVRFFRTHDGSPITLASYFLKEMVKQLFPERDGLPICMVLPHSMAQDLRGKTTIMTRSCRCSYDMTRRWMPFP